MGLGRERTVQDSVAKQERGFKPISTCFANWRGAAVHLPTLHRLKQSRAFCGVSAALSPRGCCAEQEKEQSTAGTARLPGRRGPGWGCGLWPGASRGASPANNAQEPLWAPISAISQTGWRAAGLQALSEARLQMLVCAGSSRAS